MDKKKPETISSSGVHPVSEEQSQDGCPIGEIFVLQVLGDSMEPTFPHRSTLIIEPTKCCKNGDFVIVHQAEEYIFRQLVVGEDGTLYLVALNHHFPARCLQHTNCIVGKVLKCVGSRRKDVCFDITVSPSHCQK